MTIILIVGKWDFRWRFLNEHYNMQMEEEYMVAEAAMRVQHPKALIINPCRYFSQMPLDRQSMKKMADTFRLYRKKMDKIYRLVMTGAFNHVLLLDDWYYYPEANMALTMLAEGYTRKFYQRKPVVSLLTDEQKQIGRERLVRQAEAEHQSKRELNSD